MDQNLFSALIEMDIAEVANDKGIISLSESQLVAMREASSEGIGSKIKALIEKFKAAIKNLFSKFFTWISNLVSNDSKIYEKYKKVFNSSKLSGCDIKGDAVNGDEYNKAVAAYDDALGSATSMRDNSEDFAAMKKTIASMEKGLETIKNINIVDSSDNTIISKIDVDDIANTVRTGYKKQVEIQKAKQSRCESFIVAAQREVEMEIKMAEKKSDVSRLNKRYEYLSKTLSLYSQIASAFMQIMTKSISIDRAVFIKLGNWALKGGSSAKNESAVYDEAQNLMLDIANEQFCEPAWENA
jgi:hypothetical protein